MSASGAYDAPARAATPMAGLGHRAGPLLLCTVGVLAEVVAVVAGRTTGARWNEAAVGLVVLAYALVGGLILWHRPGHPIGRACVAIVAVWGVGEALVATSYAALVHDGQDTAAALGSVAGSFLRGLPWMVAVMWLPLRFPDGRPIEPTRLLRAAERVVATTIALFAAVALFSPTLTDTRVEKIDNPVGATGVLGQILEALAAVLILFGMAAIALGVTCLVRRSRRGGALTRQQTLIFAIAFVPPIAAFAASFNDGVGPWLFGVASLPLPVAIGVAVLQRKLYDIPLVVNRSLTYAALWALIAALYALTVGGVGVMARQRNASWLPWVAAGIVAVTFAPLRDALQRAANRLTYGQWSEPGDVLSRTSRRLADAGDIHPLLGSLATDLADGLGLGYVEISAADGRTLAVAGASDGEVDELPLTAYGAPVGALRWRQRRLRERDRALLVDIATQLGSAVHADGLLASVRAAQERLVLAREEERRRLRRDLHDGLGPALAGLTLRVDTVRNQLTSPDTAEHGLLGLRDGIQQTVLDVRRIVEGLRPAALDDLGLVEAVHQLAGHSGNSRPAVDVVADPLPRLPAAVEVAAYRIVQEALANATRHAGAGRITLDLALAADGLTVTVSDDGTGVVVPRTDGVGLGSMRGRAEEVGGRFELIAEPGTGTTVTATLPLVAQP